MLSDAAGLAVHVGLGVLVEAHASKELEQALALPIPLIGINNRNPLSFETARKPRLNYHRRYRRAVWSWPRTASTRARMRHADALTVSVPSRSAKPSCAPQVLALAASTSCPQWQTNTRWATEPGTVRGAGAAPGSPSPIDSGLAWTEGSPTSSVCRRHCVQQPSARASNVR